MLKKLKKITNKGFSLVELIVVVGIMAILTAVIAPTLIGMQVEARKTSDETKLESICTALKNGLSQEEVIREIDKDPNWGDESFYITFTSDETGLIDITKGIITHENGTISNYSESKLGLNSYQAIGTTVQLEYSEYYNRSFKFDIVPKKYNTTAKCTYKIVGIEDED